MIYYKIKPKSLPKVMFAHYFAKKDYSQHYPYYLSDIEICYVKNGYFDIVYSEQTIRVPQGSILIFCRKMYPITFIAEPNIIHMHLTCSINLEYDLEITEDQSEPINSNENVLNLPLFLPPSDDTKKVAKKLNQIIIDYNSSESNSLSCAISILGLLGELSMIYKNTLYEKNDISSSILCYKIKKYISSNISKNITLSDIATEIGKSQNYLNSVFKRNEGIPIGQYITREKIHMLIEVKKASIFK